MRKTNYYIGDLHFGCINKYENRTLETDKHIIENWNRVVHQNDDVYLLGDIGRFGGNRDNEYLCQCLSVLKGRKHWILGNHDIAKDARINQLFVEICDYKEITDNYNGLNHKLALNHCPIFTWNGAYKGTIHLYAHVHGNTDGLLYQESLQKLRELCIDENIKGFQIKNPPYAFNVGAMLDYMNYCPRTLKEILDANDFEKENK